jgi:hypothetical protein
VFEAVLEVAKDRGYLARSEFAEWRAQIPTWLIDLWSAGGIGRLEQRLGIILPGAVRAFYAISELVVCVQSLDPYERDFLFAGADHEPTVCSWAGHKHLALAMHGHSGGVYAVELEGGDDPPMATGFDDEPEAIGPLAKRFSTYIRHAVRRGPPRPPKVVFKER